MYLSCVWKHLEPDQNQFKSIFSFIYSLYSPFPLLFCVGISNSNREDKIFQSKAKCGYITANKGRKFQGENVTPEHIFKNLSLHRLLQTLTQLRKYKSPPHISVQSKYSYTSAYITIDYFITERGKSCAVIHLTSMLLLL